jgi:glycerol uptake facilitator protein
MVMSEVKRQCTGECIGTFLLVFFGTGSVASAVTTGAQQGLWQVAVVWGFGVALSIYATAGVSGAHLNPAVSVALYFRRPAEMPLKKLPHFILAQLVGSVLAGCLVFAVYGSALSRLATEMDAKNGAKTWDKELTGKVFGEYFPDPGGRLTSGDITPVGACAIEALGTALLMFMIFALTDERNPARPPPGMAPFFIGFTVAVLISLFAPLTQAGFNPARDFGPRIVAFLAGWGETAIPGPRGGFWVYIVGPLIGAPVGGAAYDWLLRPALPLLGLDNRDEAPARAGLPSAQWDDVAQAKEACMVSGCWDPTQAEMQRAIMVACTQACKVVCNPQPATASSMTLGREREQLRMLHTAAPQYSPPVSVCGGAGAGCATGSCDSDPVAALDLEVALHTHTHTAAPPTAAKPLSLRE